MKLTSCQTPALHRAMILDLHLELGSVYQVFSFQTDMDEQHKQCMHTFVFVDSFVLSILLLCVTLYDVPGTLFFTT